MKTESTVKPTERFKVEIVDGRCTVYFFDLNSIQKKEVSKIENEETETMYLYDMYKTTISNRPKLKEQIESNFENFLELAKTQEYDEKAKEVRKKRNKLLEETDKEMCLDRIGLEIPEGTTFSSWLSFLKSLGNAITGNIAKYRQELRDITKQEGFPYDVKFPEKPNANEESEG